MWEQVNNRWQNIRSSLWFLPTLLVAAAIVLSQVALRLDRLLVTEQSVFQDWLFSGTADAARSLLSTIAGSLVTVISIAFSMTLIAVQQVSVQWSPRSLERLTGNRVNQFVLGMYIATFTFALLTLRAVRSASEEPGTGFVPALSITVAQILALVCLGLLIYFIHHIAQSLQVETIMHDIQDKLLQHIERLYPSSIGEALEEGGPGPTFPVSDLQATHTIRATTSGYLRYVDEDALWQAPLCHVQWLRVCPCIGDFIPQGGTLVELASSQHDDERVEAIRRAFVLDRTRSMEQDPLFGVRQLVDIALKALSPGINDPTTAEHALFYLGNALGCLAQRHFPAAVRTLDEGDTVLIFNRPTWDDFVTNSFSQIRREAEDDVHVTGRLLTVLSHLAERISVAERRSAIQHQLDEIARAIDNQSFSDSDKARLRKQIYDIERCLLMPSAGVLPEP